EQEAPVSAVSATRLSDVREQIDSLTPTTTTKSKPNEYAVLPPVDSAESIPKSIELKDVSASKITPIGQLHNSFIVAADDDGLLLIDQHVAHERILFDKFRKAEIERPLEMQRLLFPETIDLTPAQAETFLEIQPELLAAGFDTLMLSGRTIAVKSIPNDLPHADLRNLIGEILETVDTDKRGTAKVVIKDEIAASLACKAAIKINMPLTSEKMSWLIDNLLITSSPTTCPHGRPIILRLSMKDIEKKFHRS
ncbi:MAG: DNA mismatch repair protein MutL, partial [Pyrinomonadaceae bacterium]